MARRSSAARAESAPDKVVPPLTGVAGRGAAALDPVIHQRTRLAIVSALAGHDALSFTELKQSLGISDGNLSVHARKLEDAGYVACRKSFADRMPLTEYRLSSKGRRALERYLGHMEDLIEAARGR